MPPVKERARRSGKAEKQVNGKIRQSEGQRIPAGFILPSAAFTLPKNQIKYRKLVEKPPEVGDVVYGSICHIGQHASLENRQGRIHVINNGSKAVFVFGNRYAPDYYEGFVPDRFLSEVDLLSRSGMIGLAREKNAKMKDPTRVRLHGYVCNSIGQILNSRNFIKITPKKNTKSRKRARMILVVGTSMNSGKSMSAAACCWALSSMGYKVRGAKVTGTASLKDILHLEDNGASPVADFTYLGYPSTYMLPREEVLHIFNTLDLKYANNSRNFWVVEIADGINQRETAMLLDSEEVRSRIYRLVFSAADSFGAIGGLQALEERFGLTPDAISGVCSGSPLSIRELREYTDIPVFNNIQRDLSQISKILL